MKSPLFLKVALCSFFAAGVLLAFLAGGRSEAASRSTTQLAQQDTPPSTTTSPKPAPAEPKGPGWAVNCKSAATEQGLECRLSQTVVTQQGGQVLADVTFLVPADKKNPQVIVRLPLGIFLRDGATLKVDDKVPLQLNFRACDRNGCYAQAPVSAEMLADLQKGKQVSVSFKNLAEKSIDVPLSLDGFPEAYAKI